MTSIGVDVTKRLLLLMLAHAGEMPAVSAPELVRQLRNLNSTRRGAHRFQAGAEIDAGRTVRKRRNIIFSSVLCSQTFLHVMGRLIALLALEEAEAFRAFLGSRRKL